jgi:hypothetical protein
MIRKMACLEMVNSFNGAPVEKLNRAATHELFDEREAHRRSLYGFNENWLTGYHATIYLSFKSISF